uniref:Mediator of RNA polymerase II transcription subunit 23 n=1 Tax=Timema bartmani TaxID=61472 RepID=A0A7R9F9N9_9NEOP|nr:unnamed protein product [Timema bartmani]
MPTEEAIEGVTEGATEEGWTVNQLLKEKTGYDENALTEDEDNGDKTSGNKVEGIEEAFSCFLVHRPELEAEKIQNWQHELQTVFIATPSEHQEAGVRQYLVMAAGMTNSSRLKMMVCECILACEKLQYLQGDFWVECFNLIRRIIGGVDYKGVREIMKGCRERAQTIPSILNASVLPQLRALENKLAHLLSSFVESFRSTAQMVSIIGHSLKRPVVEHSGYADHLINPWKLDPATLKFTLKGNLPYDPELLKPQTGLLRYVLEQPYSRDMVCSMLGLQKQTHWKTTDKMDGPSAEGHGSWTGDTWLREKFGKIDRNGRGCARRPAEMETLNDDDDDHKQRCVALEEQLVELVILAMERSETEADSEDVTNSHWLWLHLSSQLIYFVLFQFASFPNIVMALHEKLAGRDLRRGRDHMMWVLLQFISGSIQRNPVS